MEERKLEGMEKARRITDIASDKLATDIVLLDSRGVCSFADYFVMTSGDSVRQLKGLAEEIVHQLKQEGTHPLHREGTAESGWILLDYGDVIVHLFSQDQRKYYSLEELWNDGKVLLRLQ